MTKDTYIMGIDPSILEAKDETIRILQEQLAREKRKVDRAKEALKFYVNIIYDEANGKYDTIMDDCGRVARTTLTLLEDE